MEAGGGASMKSFVSTFISATLSPIFLFTLAATVLVARTWPSLQDSISGQGLTGPEALLLASPILKALGSLALLLTRGPLIRDASSIALGVATKTTDDEFNGLPYEARKVVINGYFNTIRPIVVSFPEVRYRVLSIGFLLLGFLTDILKPLINGDVPVYVSVYILGALSVAVFILLLILIPYWTQKAQEKAKDAI